MNPETGLIELQLRLPCNHIVGSGCIARWLKSNNSCPMCRREFFPAEVQPDLEDDLVDIQEDEDQVDEEDEGEQRRRDVLQSCCDSYCSKLRLDDSINRIALKIIQNLLHIYPFMEIVGDRYDQRAIEAIILGIYIASYLGDSLRSPREISRIPDSYGNPYTSISSDHIRSLYRVMYSRKNSIIDEEIEEFMTSRHVDWPTLYFTEISDDQIECSRDITATNDYCETYCDRLQMTGHLRSFSQYIAQSLVRAGFRSFDSPEDRRDVLLWEVAAVSIYIASHLGGQPVSRAAIQNLIGDDDPDIRSSYRLVREYLVEEDLREALHMQISWESLEAEACQMRARYRNGDTGDDGYPGGSMIDNEPTIMAIPRKSLVQDLCTNYCALLTLHDRPRTEALAHRIVEKFIYLEECSLESLAAACVYMACTCIGNPISCRDLVAATSLNLRSIYQTHMMMCDEIVFNTVSIEDIMQSAAGEVSVQEVSQHIPMS